MATNIALTSLTYKDATGTGMATEVAIEIQILINGSDYKYYLCKAQDLLVTVDDSTNYMDLRYGMNVIYSYAPGDTYNGSPVADALAMYNSQRNALIS